MGEMADLYIDKMLDAWEFDGYDDYEQPSTPRCKFCGSEQVKWRWDSDRWRLYDTRRVHPGNYMPEHNCLRRPAEPDDFEVLT